MDNEHKDVLGNVLMRGDLVVTMSGHYRDLVKARVLDFTPKMIKLEFLGKKNWRGDPETALKMPNQVCRYGHQP